MQTDYNFHRIISAVRTGMEPQTHSFNSAHQEGQFGSALMLVAEELIGELWTHDLNVISMQNRDLRMESWLVLWLQTNGSMFLYIPNRQQLGPGARILEMFLDYLGSLSCDRYFAFPSSCIALTHVCS